MSLEVELFTQWVAEIYEAKSVEALQEMLDDATAGNRSLIELLEAKNSFTANPTDNNAANKYRIIHRNRVLYRLIPGHINNRALLIRTRIMLKI